MDHVAFVRTSVLRGIYFWNLPLINITIFYTNELYTFVSRNIPILSNFCHFPPLDALGYYSPFCGVFSWSRFQFISTYFGFTQNIRRLCRKLREYYIIYKQFVPFICPLKICIIDAKLTAVNIYTAHSGSVGRRGWLNYCSRKLNAKKITFQYYF